MGSLGQSVLSLSTDSTKFDKGLGDSKKSAESWSAGIGGFAKTAALGIAAVGLAAIAVAVGFIKAAADEQQGMIRLQQAVKNTGASWNDSGQQVEAFIAKSERLSAFSDNELRDSLAVLVAQTGDVGDAMLRSSAAQDLARGTGMDLMAASRLLGKATDDNANVLARYGIKMEKGASTTELMIEVQKRFGGQSKAYSESVLGQWEQVQHQFGNVSEEIGGVLLPVASLVLGAVLRAIDAIRTGPLPGVIAGLKNVSTAIIGAFTVGPIATFVQGIFSELARIPGFVAQVVGSIGEVFDVLTGRRPEAGGVLASLVGAGQASSIMGTVAAVRDAFRSAFDVLAPVIQKAIDKVGELKAKFDELPPVVRNAFGIAAVGQISGVNDMIINMISNTVTGIVGFGILTTKIGILGAAMSAIGIEGVILQFMYLAEGIGGAAIVVGAFVLAALPFILLAAAIGIAVYLLVTHWTELGDTIGMIGAIIGHFIGQAGAAIGGFLGFWVGVWQEITSKPGYYFGLMVGFLFGQLLNLAQGIADFAGTALATILGWMTALGAAWSAFWAQDVSAILVAAVGNLLATVISFGQNLWTTISGALGELKVGWDAFWADFPASMQRIGESIVRGIWEGIQNLAGWLMDQARGFAQGIFDGIMTAIRGGSPSMLFAEVGASMVTGLVKGITDRADQPARALADVLTGLAGPGLDYSLSGALPGAGGQSASGRSAPMGDSAGHGHDIYMDGRLVGGLLGARTVRGTALAGAGIG